MNIFEFDNKIFVILQGIIFETLLVV